MGDGPDHSAGGGAARLRQNFDVLRDAACDGKELQKVVGLPGRVMLGEDRFNDAGRKRAQGQFAAGTAQSGEKRSSVMLRPAPSDTVRTSRSWVSLRYLSQRTERSVTSAGSTVSAF